MKIFLCGGDSKKNIFIKEKLNKVIDHTKPLLYVPLAMNNTKYQSCLQEIEVELKEIKVPYIEMVTSNQELSCKNFKNYACIFIDDGNPLKLLKEIKDNNTFLKLIDYIFSEGILFGRGAGAMIMGYDIKLWAIKDKNDVNSKNMLGFDILNGISIFCNHPNNFSDQDKINTNYLIEKAKNQKILFLPKEDTLYYVDGTIEVLGTKPWYIWEDGDKITFNEKHNRYEKFMNLKNENELMTFMNENITYGWLDKSDLMHLNNLKNFREKYKIGTLEKTLETGLGICIEQALIIKCFFDHKGIENKLYCHRAYETEDNFDKTVKMHCFVLFKKDDAWYHFEHSNRPARGIHKYSSINEALQRITMGFKDENDIRILTKIPHIPVNLTFKEFNNYVNSFDEIKLD